MPDPFTNNDKAAAYAYYYASPQMVETTVNRLYHGGVRHQHLARARVEHEMYPPIRAAQRTPAQIEAYLQQRVHTELLRRQQHRAVLQRELYPAAYEEHGAGRHRLTKEELRRHLEQVYEKPKALSEWRRMCWQRLTSSEPERQRGGESVNRAGGKENGNYAHRDSPYPRGGCVCVAHGDEPRSSRAVTQRNGEGDNKNKENVARIDSMWRMPSASVPHKEDADARLFSQKYYEVCAAQVHAEEERLRRRLARRAKARAHARSGGAEVEKEEEGSGYSESEDEEALTARLRRSVQAATRSLSPPKMKSRPQRGEDRRRRLSDLAKPLHVTPRYESRYKDPHAPSSFHVVKKIDYITS